MGRTGETILSVDEQETFAEITSDYDNPQGTIAIGGLSATLADRIQGEASVQRQRLATGQKDVNVEASAFQSAA
jgi:hypothetical protein